VLPKGTKPCANLANLLPQEKAAESIARTDSCPARSNGENHTAQSIFPIIDVQAFVRSFTIGATRALTRAKRLLPSQLLAFPRHTLRSKADRSWTDTCAAGFGGSGAGCRTIPSLFKRPVPTRSLGFPELFPQLSLRSLQRVRRLSIDACRSVERVDQQVGQVQPVVEAGVQSQWWRLILDVEMESSRKQARSRRNNAQSTSTWHLQLMCSRRATES
jgi:hypothetical protein